MFVYSTMCNGNGICFCRVPCAVEMGYVSLQYHVQWKWDVFLYSTMCSGNGLYYSNFPIELRVSFVTTALFVLWFHVQMMTCCYHTGLVQ
jgi:hypothetical protein